MSAKITNARPLNPENTVSMLRRILKPLVKNDSGPYELMLETMLQAMRDALSPPTCRLHKSGSDFLKSEHFPKLCELLGLDPKWMQTKWTHYKTVYETTLTKGLPT